MVDVSIEVMHECLIQEVTLDGQEIYVQPLSMSENLTKLAHKIDFSKDESDEKGKPTSEGVEEEETEEEKTVAPLQPSLWPWDSVRNKLKTSLVEMSVLQDVLVITRSKQYMHLDPAATEVPEQRGNLLLVARKKALLSASSILCTGFDRLKRAQESITRRTNPDFHGELMRLRQHWRLRKVGKSILGDLSYKSAGSHYWQSGTFEVSKADDSGAKETMDGTIALSPQVRGPGSTLRVTIPSELEGVALIQVVIRDLMQGVSVSGSVDLNNIHLGVCKKLTGTVPPDAHWQKKLEAAQNVIFCKEIFAQLAREAVQVRSQIPHIVLGNQIISHLFPGIHLSISLCHNTEKTKQSAVPDNQQKVAHNHVLEHSIHQLLREIHHNNAFQPMPHPVSSMLGVSKRRRLAGPRGYTRTQLQELTQSESMLERIVQQGRHLVVWQKTLRLIDEMALEIQDPQIVAHTSVINSATESIVKVCISFSNYEMVKTVCSLHVNVDTIQAICRDGRIVTMSYESQQLRDLILCQISEHHLMFVQQTAKLLGWKILSTSNHIGTGDLETIGTAQGIMIVSPNNYRVLSIRCSPLPTNPVKVYIRKCPNIADCHASNAVQRPEWAGMNEFFQEICLNRVKGCNFAQKIETIMACLLPDRSEYGLY